MGNINEKLKNTLFIHISNLIKALFGSTSSSIKHHEDQTPMAEKDVNNLSADYFCQICNIHCSNIFSYRQHIDGKNHKKKVTRRGFQQTKTNEAHNISAAHPVAEDLKKVEKEENYIVIPSHSSTNSESFESELSDRKELNNLSHSDNKYDFCEVCQVPCSGFFPYQQHVQGKRHKKQLAIFQAKHGVNKVNQDKDESYKSSSNCPLNPDFISNFTINCHLSSNQSNVTDNSLNVSEIETLISNIEKQGYGLTFFCKICEVPCSGYFSYEQHLRGDKHRKKRNIYFFQLQRDASGSS